MAVLHNIALFREPGRRSPCGGPDGGGRRISAGQGCAVGGAFPIIDYCPEHGRLAQLVRAPRSHRGGRRFKSSIAHHVVRDPENRATARAPRAEVAEWQTRCVQGAVSLRMCGFKSLPRHQPANRPNRIHRALVAQWIERCPAEAEVVSSNLAKRATCFPFFAPSDPHGVSRGHPLIPPLPLELDVGHSCRLSWSQSILRVRQNSLVERPPTS